MGRLDNKVAIVTGGGRGIGRAIAERFAEEGAEVLTAQRSTPEPFTSERIHARTLDVCDSAALAALVDEAVHDFGGLNIVVNNAGAMVEQGIEAMSEAEWDRMLAVNLKAPFLLCKQALPALRRRGGGAIVNIGSIEGIGANPGHAAYAAAKAGVHGLTVALAVDLGPENIRCNTIAPGWIQTALNREYVDSRPDRAEVEAELAVLHPVGRLGDPRDIADTALWLASDEAAFVTGQRIVVDGGRLSKLPLPARLS